MYFSYKNAIFQCREDQLIGCCGVMVLHHVSFNYTGRMPKERKEEFYKQLLKVMKGRFKGRWASLLMSDNLLTGKGALNIPSFCKATGWLEGDKVGNPNHNRRPIQVFELPLNKPNPEIGQGRF